MVVNKIDILESETDLAQVVDFVAQNFHKLLAVAPEIFPVSAKDALRAKVSNDHPLLNRSGFETLEEFITSTLDETERIRLKLLSPIGVASRLTDKYLEVVDQRLELLKEDFRTLEEIEQQLALYEEDRSREFRYRKADIDNVLLDFEARGMAFFEETINYRSGVIDCYGKIRSDNNNFTFINRFQT